MGFSSILTGPELRHHGPQDARAGHDLEQDAAVHLGRCTPPPSIQVLATPVLGHHAGCCSLIETHARKSASSTRRMGGDPVLFQHFFWFYSHPAVYIMILPGLRHHLRAHGQRPLPQAHLYGYRAIALSSVSIALSSASSCGATTCSRQRAEHVLVDRLSRCFLTFADRRCRQPSRSSVGWRRCTSGSIEWLNTPMLYGLIFLFTVHHRWSSRSCSWAP